MKFIKGTMLIETKIPEENKDKMAKIICNWADKYEMYACFGTNAEGKHLCEYEKKVEHQLFVKVVLLNLKI